MLDIWNDLVERASLDVADHVLRDIEQAIEKLADPPGPGHKRTDLTKRDLLFYRVHSWLIIYRRDSVPLRVVRVLHAARDIGNLIDE